MDRGSRVVVAAVLTLLSVPIVVVNGVLYDRVGVEAVAVWLVLESLFLTLTGAVIIRLPVTHSDTGVSQVTKRHYERIRRVRAAYRTLRRDGRLSKRNEGFDDLVRLLNKGTDFEGGGREISLDGSAREPRRAVVAVDGVPLDLTLANIASAIESYGKRVERKRATERTRRQREFVLLGTSVLVMSMLLQVAAVVIFE